MSEECKKKPQLFQHVKNHEKKLNAEELFRIKIFG